MKTIHLAAAFMSGAIVGQMIGPELGELATAMLGAMPPEARTATVFHTPQELARKYGRKKPHRHRHNHYTRWEKGEEKLLEEGVMAGLSNQRMARELGRTEQAVSTYIYKRRLAGGLLKKGGDNA